MDAFVPKVEFFSVSAPESGGLRLSQVIQRHDAERADTVDDQVGENGEVSDPVSESSLFVLPPIPPLSPLSHSTPSENSFLLDGQRKQLHKALRLDAVERKLDKERFENEDGFLPFHDRKILYAAASASLGKLNREPENQLIQWAANQNLDALGFLSLLSGYLKKSA